MTKHQKKMHKVQSKRNGGRNWLRALMCKKFNIQFFQHNKIG